MRNKYPGMCYRCGERIEIGEGHFQMRAGGGATQHAECAIAYRGTNETKAVRPHSKMAAERIYAKRNGLVWMP